MTETLQATGCGPIQTTYWDGTRGPGCVTGEMTWSRDVVVSAPETDLPAAYEKALAAAIAAAESWPYADRYHLNLKAPTVRVRVSVSVTYPEETP